MISRNFLNFILGNQSNSDTYAVINLPEDEMEDEVALRSDHPYSKGEFLCQFEFSRQIFNKFWIFFLVDRNRKRKAVSQPNATNGGTSNVDEMYAKVQKNVPLQHVRSSWNANAGM